MVGQVVRSPSKAWQQPMQCPREVICAVILHSHPGVDHMEKDFTYRMAAHQHGTDKCKGLKRQQFGYTGVLGGQCKCLPVQVMNTMDVVKEPRNSEGKHTEFRL